MKHILYTDSKKKLVNVEKRYFPQAFRIAEISQLRFSKVKLCESCLLYFTIRYFPTHLEKMKHISGVLTLDFVLFFSFCEHTTQALLSSLKQGVGLVTNCEASDEGGARFEATWPGGGEPYSTNPQSPFTTPSLKLVRE